MRLKRPPASATTRSTRLPGVAPICSSATCSNAIVSPSAMPRSSSTVSASSSSLVAPPGTRGALAPALARRDAARVAHLDLLHEARRELLRAHAHARPVAVGALALALAVLHAHDAPHVLELERLAEVELRERHAQRHLDVGGALLARLAPPAAAEAERFEDRRERVAAALRALLLALEPLLALRVVHAALLAVGEHLVRRVHLGELLDRVRVRVLVGVELEREPPVRLLDLAVRRAARDAEDLVQVGRRGEPDEQQAEEPRPPRGHARVRVTTGTPSVGTDRCLRPFRVRVLFGWRGASRV